MLVLTTTLRGNGAPIWAVIALTLDGQTMNMAQMLERSQTIKRGAGHRQADLTTAALPGDRRFWIDRPFGVNRGEGQRLSIAPALGRGGLFLFGKRISHF